MYNVHMNRFITIYVCINRSFSGNNPYTNINNKNNGKIRKYDNTLIILILILRWWLMPGESPESRPLKSIVGKTFDKICNSRKAKRMI